MRHTYIFGSFLVLVILMVFFMPLCRKSYFGSGPQIFMEDNSNKIDNINLEPVYQKTSIPL
jgi:hypothetical protein